MSTFWENAKWQDSPSSNFGPPLPTIRFPNGNWLISPLSVSIFWVHSFYLQSKVVFSQFYSRFWIFNFFFCFFWKKFFTFPASFYSDIKEPSLFESNYNLVFSNKMPFFDWTKKENYCFIKDESDLDECRDKFEGYLSLQSIDHERLFLKFPCHKIREIFLSETELPLTCFKWLSKSCKSLSVKL